MATATTKQATLQSTIPVVEAGKTYHGTGDTELTASGYHLEPGDVPSRWRIVNTHTGRNAALLVLH